MSRTRRLVTIAVRSSAGPANEVAEEITARAARTLGVRGSVSYVDASAPAAWGPPDPGDEPSVVVPLLLSTAHHLQPDLPTVLAGHDALLTPALGPHPLIAAAQASRLIGAGARPGTPVVMVALGSEDPGVDAHLEQAVRMLSDTWTGPVELATLRGRGPRIADVVRRGVVVSPYLLTPGADADALREASLAAGARVVGDVVRAHRFVSDLVTRRVRAIGTTRTTTAA